MATQADVLQSKAEAVNKDRIQRKAEIDPEDLSPDEVEILKTIRARQMLRTEDTMNIDNFATDAIEGYAPKIKKGGLTLVEIGQRAAPKLRSEMDISPGVDRSKGKLNLCRDESEAYVGNLAMPIKAH